MMRAVGVGWGRSHADPSGEAGQLLHGARHRATANQLAYYVRENLRECSKKTYMSGIGERMEGENS